MTHIQTCGYFIHCYGAIFLHDGFNCCSDLWCHYWVCLTGSRRVCYRTIAVHELPSPPYTCRSDRHASPYWTFICWWISMGFTSSLLKKRMTERCSSLVQVASGAAIFTLLLRRRVAFLHRTATCQPTAAVTSGVTTGCAWPCRGESVTELMPFMNFPVHSYTCCSDRHASPYWTVIRRWISMGFTPSLLQKRMTERCCKRGRQLFTTAAPSCCSPSSYCHLSATLQTISITVVNLQDNRAVFRIFIAILRFSFDSPS